MTRLRKFDIIGGYEIAQITIDLMFPTWHGPLNMALYLSTTKILSTNRTDEVLQPQRLEKNER